MLHLPLIHMPHPGCGLTHVPTCSPSVKPALPAQCTSTPCGSWILKYRLRVVRAYSNGGRARRKAPVRESIRETQPSIRNEI